MGEMIGRRGHYKMEVAVALATRPLGHNRLQCGRCLFEGETRAGRIAA